MQTDVVDKEVFVYPPANDFQSPDFEPEVDQSILKKDNVILKLKTIT